MKNYCILLIIFCFGKSKEILDEICKDFYWRDWHGHTPHDAIEGGQDDFGNIFYIGQVYFPGKTVQPGMIIPKLNRVESVLIENDNRNSYSTERTCGNNPLSRQVKILCSPYPQAFEWKWIESDQLQSFVNSSVTVVECGGVEHDIYYIGKVFHNGGIVLGNVLRAGTTKSGITIPSLHNGCPENVIYNAYYLLIFNCNKIIRNPTSTPKIEN